MSEVKVKDITDHLESIAPRAYQESYDNTGLLTGNFSDAVTGVLVTLDCTEEVVQEAIDRGCNLVVAHHPILFKGLKKLTGSNYIERTILKAVRHNIAIYAIHTNLDNVFIGVNRKIAEKIGLENLRVLVPKPQTLMKLVAFIPQESLDKAVNALHRAGAGQIGNYENCSFSVEGTGTFRPREAAKPAIGTAGKQEFVVEMRVELIFPSFLKNKIIEALKQSHPYEEVAYYLTALENDNQEVGAGMVGELPNGLEPLEFLQRLKERMELRVVRHTRLLNRSIKKVALCGGSGSFLLSQAIQSGADAYVSSDFKYHEFFDAENRIIIADIGHYESEVFTKELIQEVLIKKFPNFAINFSSTVTNPISYL